MSVTQKLIVKITSAFISIMFFIIVVSNVIGSERATYSKGKEKYVAEVLIRFTPGFWNPKHGQPGPYQLSIYEEGTLSGPPSISVDRWGNIYILDAGNYRIQKYDSKGKFLSSIGIDAGKRRSGSDFCIDKHGNIYILDTNPGISSYYMDYLDLRGSSKGKKLYEIRQYNQKGMLIHKAYFLFSHDWLKKTGIIPQKIYVDYKENLYLGYNSKLCRIGFSSGKSDILEVKEILEGIPSPYDSTLSFYLGEKLVDKHRIHVRKLDAQRKTIKSFDLIVNENVSGMEFLGNDNNMNSYLAISKYISSGNIKYYDSFWEIRKIDKSGTSIVRIDNLPVSSTFCCRKDKAIDRKGNIYYLSIKRNGGELIKWYKQ